MSFPAFRSCPKILASPPGEEAGRDKGDVHRLIQQRNSRKGVGNIIMVQNRGAEYKVY